MLTDADHAELQAFAKANGRRWKAELRALWERAAASPVLMQLRNASYFGPAGLIRFQSAAQRERQGHREHGKYAKVNPCYHCGESAGVNYVSHRETDGAFNDEGLCLCPPCCEFLESLPNDESLRRLQLANYGSNPQPRK
jgi:hypothetical protein